VVAFAVLAPPLGAIVAVALLAKAVKNKFYDGSKLEERVNEKFFNKPPEKFDSQQLEQVTVKGLSQDVKSQYSSVDQEQQRGGELGREASRAAAPDDRGQSIQEVRDQARELGGSMRDQGISSSGRSSDSVGGSHVEAVRKSHNASAARAR